MGRKWGRGDSPVASQEKSTRPRMFAFTECTGTGRRSSRCPASIRVTYASSMITRVVPQIGSFERYFVEQLFHHRVQAPRADVLRALVHDCGEVGDAVESASSVKDERRCPRFPSAPCTASPARFAAPVRMRTNSSAAESVELDANRKASLQLRNEIGRLRDVKGAGRDEQDVIGPHHPVLRVDGRAFDDGQDVALHALAADVRTCASLRGPRSCRSRR